MNEPNQTPKISKEEAQRRADILLKWLESDAPVDVNAPMMPDEVFREIWPEKAAARDAGRLVDPAQEWINTSFAHRRKALEKLVGALAESGQLTSEQQAELLQRPQGGEVSGRIESADAAAMYELAAKLVTLRPELIEAVDRVLQRPLIPNIARPSRGGRE